MAPLRRQYGKERSLSIKRATSIPGQVDIEWRTKLALGTEIKLVDHGAWHLS